MKKILSLILSLIIIFTLCACGTQKETPKTTAPIATESTTSSAAYENKSLSIGFKLPDNWQFYEREEIDKLFASVDTDSFSKVSYLCDMFAVSKDRLSNVNVMFEQKNEATMGLSPEKLIKNSAELVEREYKTVYKDVKMELLDCKIEDNSYPGYEISFSFGGEALCQRAFMTEKDNSNVTISITAPESKKIDEIIKNFYIIK